MGAPTPGQPLLYDPALGSYQPADPIVSGPDAAGIQPTKNPVQTGGLDYKSNNIVRPHVTDHFGHPQITVGHETGLTDAYGRLRSSSPRDLIQLKFLYDLNPLRCVTAVNGAGSSVALASSTQPSALLTAGTSAGSYAVIQSKAYLHYEPGKSTRILQTGILGAQKTGVDSRIGYFDQYDGLFFEMDGTQGAGVVQRSNVSGTPVNTRINQANWSIDKLDGTGPSGALIDWTKSQIFIIDFQWLGSGIARFGIALDSEVTYCHEILNANVLTVPYMANPDLPIRWEITNSAATASPTTALATCGTVQSEGGDTETPAIQFSVGNGATLINVNARRPILSLQPKLTFGTNSRINRMKILIQRLEILAQAGGDVYWELIYGGALTGSSFVSADPNAGVNFDVSSTTISGGTRFASGYVSTGSKQDGLTIPELFDAIPITLDYTGTIPDTLSVVCTGIGGAVPCGATVQWSEER